MGKKDKLLATIHERLDGLLPPEGGTMIDLFAGTGSVARSYKEIGFSVTTSDVLAFCVALHQVEIGTNVTPAFLALRGELGLPTSSTDPLQDVLDWLDGQPPLQGFIWRHYTVEGTANDEVQRQFFTPENGARIDRVRSTIDAWAAAGLLDETERVTLIACVVAAAPYYANVSGVYAAYLKSYDPRALKQFRLRAVRPAPGGGEHRCLLGDGVELLSALGPVDLLYLDPPYNGRQYGSNYGLLETIARYDSPEIKGVAGLRDYSAQKSAFCSKRLALPALAKVAATGNYRVLALSYNSEGIMPREAILETLRAHGTVTLHEVDYPRFKSNSHGEQQRVIQEQLYVLARD
jgi:adenine-specific DNA-methyltransferase